MMNLIKRNSKTVAIAAAFACAIPVAGTALSSAPAAAQSGDIDRVVKALRAISTMKADFVQQDRNGNAWRGELTLKRPGKIRFDYGKNADLLVVSNGSSLYMIDYEVDQVQRWPIKSTPLGALLDPSRDVAQYGKLKPTSHKDVVSIEISDPKKPEFGTMTMVMVRDGSAPGGLRLTHWVALDAQNHRTTVRLSNHRYGMSVSDGTFKFNDPRRSSRRPR